MVDLKDKSENPKDAAPLTHELLARKGQAVSATWGAEATPVRDLAETARNEAATPADTVDGEPQAETAASSVTLPRKAIFAGVAFLVIGSVAVGYFLRPQTAPGNTQGVETQAALAAPETTQSSAEAAPQESNAPLEAKVSLAPEQVSPAAGASTATDVTVASGPVIDKPDAPTTTDVLATAGSANRKDSLSAQPVVVATKAVVQQAAAVEPEQVKPLKTPSQTESAVADKSKAIVPTPYAEAKQDSKERVERSAAAQSLPPIPSPKAITPPAAPAVVKVAAPVTVDAVKPAKEAPPPVAVKAAPKPRPKAVKPTIQTARRAEPPKAAAASAYFVQLVSVKSENAADREWGRLSKRFTKLFNGLEPSIQKASVAGKGTFYRLRAAGFDTQGQARDLCRKLKAAKQSCLVVRR